jgi:carboxyl-terminal processing protease
MKKMIYRSSVVLLLVLGFLGFKKINSTTNAKIEKSTPVDEKEALILQAVMTYVQQVHFDPKPVDDNMSKYIFKEYLKRLDRGKRYFTQKDIDFLKKHELDIDDQINTRRFDFFEDSYRILQERMVAADSTYFRLIRKKFDLGKSKQIELDEDKLPWAKDEKQLEEYWDDYLTNDIVMRMERKMNDESKKENKSEVKSKDAIYAEVITDVKKTFTDWFERLGKLRRSDRFETYVGTITNYFDPHTDFFNPKEKQDFNINMGGRLEGIGARLQTEGDYIKITTVMPGGPAWKSKQIVDGDIILSAAQEGQKAVELVGMRVDDAVQYIRGKKGTKVTLSIKKQDGTTKSITLVREAIVVDESFARSVIMDMPGVLNNVGYINLPKFYSTFDDEEASTSCAVDVAKEIEKLKTQNVNGIILDLRNNTGGSLSDVVDMSGFFIEEGPIVQVKSRGAKPSLQQDRDSGVKYNGPLIILVNTMSASASEIIAAAMQDYKRAVIVGGNSTFGKGSVQRFFNLDRAITGADQFKPLGEIKMSTQKFYRINGQTTQLKGVIPDIILPDNYSYIEAGEKEYDQALPSTVIEALPFKQNVAILDNIPLLKAKSQERVSKSADFSLVVENAKRLKTNRENTKVSLSLDEYKKEVAKIESESKKFDEIMKKDIPGFSVRNIDVDKLELMKDESKKARFDEWMKGLKKDFYLTETINIMKDLISNEKSFAAIKSNIK